MELTYVKVVLEKSIKPLVELHYLGYLGGVLRGSERQVSFARIRYGESEAIAEFCEAHGIQKGMGYRVNPITREPEYLGLLAV